MKFAVLFLSIVISGQCHAMIMNGSITGCGSSRGQDGASACTMYTTFSFPTLIVDDANGEEVWNASNEELLTQYKNELNGSSPIYAIKRYADVKTGGDVKAAIVEIKQNLEILEKQKQ
ncbi:MAG: hypothetical protein ACXVCY_02525 [Pseudobdellovibrionaceae bacterium]